MKANKDIFWIDVIVLLVAHIFPPIIAGALRFDTILFMHASTYRTRHSKSTFVWLYLLYSMDFPPLKIRVVTQEYESFQIKKKDYTTVRPFLGFSLRLINMYQRGCLLYLYDGAWRLHFLVRTMKLFFETHAQFTSKKCNTPRAKKLYDKIFHNFGASKIADRRSPNVMWGGPTGFGDWYCWIVRSCRMHPRNAKQNKNYGIIWFASNFEDVAAHLLVFPRAL